MDGIQEIFKLVATTDPDSHQKLIETFKFHRDEAEKNKDYYKNLFRIETIHENNALSPVEWDYEESEVAYYNGLVHSYLDKPAKIIVRPNDPGYSRFEWYKNGNLSRENGPAEIIYYSNGEWEKSWYRDGKLHREDGPAIEESDGSYRWYRDDIKHREQPPIGSYPIYDPEERFQGYKYFPDSFAPASYDNDIIKTTKWYKNGELHGENRPAIITSDGEAWYKNGKLHRDNGPAVIEFGENLWYKDGKLHRVDGPAIIPGKSFYGKKLGGDWYIEGHLINPETHKIVVPWGSGFSTYTDDQLYEEQKKVNAYFPRDSDIIEKMMKMEYPMQSKLERLQQQPAATSSVPSVPTFNAPLPSIPTFNTPRPPLPSIPAPTLKVTSSPLPTIPAPTFKATSFPVPSSPTLLSSIPPQTLIIPPPRFAAPQSPIRK